MTKEELTAFKAEIDKHRRSLDRQKTKIFNLRLHNRHYDSRFILMQMKHANADLSSALEKLNIISHNLNNEILNYDEYEKNKQIRDFNG